MAITIACVLVCLSVSITKQHLWLQWVQIWYSVPHLHCLTSLLCLVSWWIRKACSRWVIALLWVSALGFFQCFRFKSFRMQISQLKARFDLRFVNPCYVHIAIVCVSLYCKALSAFFLCFCWLLMRSLVSWLNLYDVLLTSIMMMLICS